MTDELAVLVGVVVTAILGAIIYAICEVDL